MRQFISFIAALFALHYFLVTLMRYFIYFAPKWQIRYLAYRQTVCEHYTVKVSISFDAPWNRHYMATMQSISIWKLLTEMLANINITSIIYIIYVPMKWYFSILCMKALFRCINEARLRGKYRGLEWNNILIIYDLWNY